MPNDYILERTWQKTGNARVRTTWFGRLYLELEEVRKVPNPPQGKPTVQYRWVRGRDLLLGEKLFRELMK